MHAFYFKLYTTLLTETDKDKQRQGKRDYVDKLFHAITTNHQDCDGSVNLHAVEQSLKKKLSGNPKIFRLKAKVKIMIKMFLLV